VPYKVTFRPNRAGIARVGNSEGAFRDLERRADKVIAIAKSTAPVRTGLYRDSFKSERTRVRGLAAVTVINTAPYANYVEFGTRPHVIEARHAQALFWPGARHPVKKVNHPGTPAFHTLRNALRAAGR
jgi:HK97 gp10 family phage protein